MATVADELYNDFADSGDENDGSQDDAAFHDDGAAIPSSPGANGHINGGMELDGDEEEAEDEEGESGILSRGGKRDDEAEDAEETKARVEKMQLHHVADVRSVAVLMAKLQPVIEKIEHYKNIPPDQQTRNIGSIEDNPEYNLLTQSNELSTRIDGEIILVHKFIRDHYSVRFPELETLVQNPLEYAKTVAIIGNGPMENIRAVSESKANLVGQSLRQVLDGPSMMVVTVEATTTRGTPLSDPELATVQRACEMTLHLDRAKRLLTSYVESRMSMFAPNLTTLIGPTTAAQLLNYAGGMTKLATTPACNIPPLGSKKNSTATTGLATNTGIRHQGFLFHNEIIRQVPSDYKVQAMRILSAKIVLAARIDQAHESPSGQQGQDFYEQVQTRIHKLQEAPPNKGQRALPAPDDKPARKRGGRRARKAKEATAVTDLRKAQNRMVFGQEEAETGYGAGDGTTKGLGMIGQQNDGRIRAQQIDPRTRAKLSKKNVGWGGGGGGGMTPGTSTSLRGFGGAAGGGGTASTLKSAGLRSSGVGGGGGGFKTNVGGHSLGGTMSTIAFTPVQGLELVDPKVRAEAERKRKVEEDRWFKGGQFTQINGAEGGGGGSRAGGGGGGGGGGKVDAAGFKVPALPTSKRQRRDG